MKSEDLLDKVGLKKTSARVALLDLFDRTKMPMSVKEITSKLTSCDVDRVTIYRMLEMFAEKGVVRRVDTGSREARYELVDIRNDHHHMICLECKKVVDFTGCDFEVVVSKALKQVKDFKSVSYHSFDLFGICNKCADK